MKNILRSNKDFKHFKHLSNFFLEMTCFFSITKNEHLHVRVNLDLRMSKDVSGLKHTVLVALGFLLFVFAFKEPYKYGCNISL